MLFPSTPLPLEQRPLYLRHPSREPGRKPLVQPRQLQLGVLMSAPCAHELLIALREIEGTQAFI